MRGRQVQVRSFLSRLLRRDDFDIRAAPFLKYRGSHCLSECFQWVRRRKDPPEFLNEGIGEAKEGEEVSENGFYLLDELWRSTSRVQRLLCPVAVRRCGDLKYQDVRRIEQDPVWDTAIKAGVHTIVITGRYPWDHISLWYNANKQTGQSILFWHDKAQRCEPPIAGVTLSTWYDISFMSRKDKLNGYENLAGPCSANCAAAPGFYTRNSHTCSKECYSTQISKFFFIDV